MNNLNIKPNKSISILDIDTLEEVYDTMFKTGNYCIINFDIGFYYIENRRTRGVFQRDAVQRLESINEEKNIKYVEFLIGERNGNDLLNIFYEAINETCSVAFAHDKTKVMYLYVSEYNIEDLIDLSKKYKLTQDMFDKTPFSWK